MESTRKVLHTVDYIIKVPGAVHSIPKADSGEDIHMAGSVGIQKVDSGVAIHMVGSVGIQKVDSGVAIHMVGILKVDSSVACIQKEVSTREHIQKAAFSTVLTQKACIKGANPEEEFVLPALRKRRILKLL